MAVLTREESHRFLSLIAESNPARTTDIVDFLLEVQEKYSFVITHQTFGRWKDLPARVSAILRDRRLGDLGIE